MLDLNAIGKKIWVDFDVDEKYLISYASEAEVAQAALSAAMSAINSEDVANGKLTQDQIEKALKEKQKELIVPIVAAHVHDWEGVTSEGEKLPCTDENRRLVFEQFALTRGDFLYSKIQSASTFSKLGGAEGNLSGSLSTN